MYALHFCSTLSTRNAPTSYTINGHWSRGYRLYWRHLTLNFPYSEVLSIAFNIFPVCLNICIPLRLSLSPFSYHRPRLSTEFSFDCRNSITGDSEVNFLHFPLHYCATSRFFNLNFILVQVINSSNLFGTLFTSPIPFARTVISSMNIFNRGFITVTFASVDFNIISITNISSTTEIVHPAASMWWNYQQ